jgi:uncharacterized repeat protein (TIGR03803 family)
MPILCCGLSVGQTYKVLWNFGSVPNDGAGPVASLISDGAGNLYGTTIGGGTASEGTVFELSPQNDGTRNETVLYNFCMLANCADGYEPQAGLIMDTVGNLYGTTYYSLCTTGQGECAGTVFELSPPSQPGKSWTYSVLYTFCSVVMKGTGKCLDGSDPHSQLIFDATGSLYGTTVQGGTGHFLNGMGGGVAFKLSPGTNGWTETVLYSFCILGQGDFCNDGASPQAGVSLDKSGNLVGTTEAGGFGRMGVVYELSPGSNGWTEEVLYVSFNGGSYAPVSFDSAGNLYSTTTNRGFQFNLKHHVAHSISFSTPTGSNSRAGVLVDFQRNALFGTAAAQGANFAGTVWQVNLAGQMTPVYDFCSQPGCTDGSAPMAGLIEDRSGNLYGTTEHGGDITACDGFGCGVVFEVTP